MGTLDTIRAGLRLLKRLSHGRHRNVFVYHAIFRAQQYLDELRARNFRRAMVATPVAGLGSDRFGPHDDEIREVEDLIHELAIACPAVDPDCCIWRGWTRGGQRVTVRRAGQTVVGRRGRARVEDAYEVRINGTLAYRGLRAHAMKQARWATMVGSDGRLPAAETARGRRRRQLLREERRVNAIVRRDFGPKRRQVRRRYELLVRQMAAVMTPEQIDQAVTIVERAPRARMALGRSRSVSTLDVLQRLGRAPLLWSPPSMVGYSP